VRQPSQGVAARFCAAIDRLNSFMGRVWGLTILFVTFAVLYEVIARGVFGQATLWANESTVYLSAMAYLIAGGYALQRRMHVRIDVVYLLFSPRGQVRADLFGFVFFLVYTMTLIWVGGDSAWTSFQQGETTGTPWNPPIWPVKAAIPLAGLLLLLQGIANIVRDLTAAREAAGRR
jgi:TRAP-type mannitol/chloroaromatic compound transport system permease small subunit